MMGFFDLEFKMDDINKHEPPLQKLDKVINWEIFRPIRIRVVKQEQGQRRSSPI